MPVIDSKSKKIVSNYTIDELEDIARSMRAYSITAISLAGLGYTGGTMSIIEIATALYFYEIAHDPNNPEWEDRDRVFWSVGHKAPALYAALGLAGYFNIDDIVKLRRLSSGFEGHPNRFKLPGIEASSGSLGQGLGIAVGSALSCRLENKNYRVYCILGDGELDEGSVWEAAMSASHYSLDNLVAIIDRNNLQIDGLTSDVMEIEPLRDKWASFGWNVYECDGHSISGILDVLEKARNMKGRPSAVIANTVKGKNISYAENVCGYHGMAPKDGRNGQESLDVALSEVGCAFFTPEKLGELEESVLTYQKEVDKKIASLVPKFSKNYFWNNGTDMKVDMEPNRNGFGKGLAEVGKDPMVVALGADITDSIKMSSFYADHPERSDRFFSMGIAEQNMTAVAAGLAKEGKIPFIGSYGVFITGRNWDQLRTTVCYNNYNVKIADAHGGISVGPDGATHQALEDISNLYYLPNMNLVVPCDSLEAEKATIAIKELYGPAAIRLAREATPVITDTGTVFEFGKANIYRYRKASPRFIDAFEVFLADDYRPEGENLSIIACGPIVAEAARAASILKEEYKIETRVVNLHTVKPPDRQAIIDAAEQTDLIITAEEHQAGGFGNISAGIVAENRSTGSGCRMKMIGVKDRFGESGQPWELMKLFGLTAEFIAEAAVRILESR